MQASKNTQDLKTTSFAAQDHTLPLSHVELECGLRPFLKSNCSSFKIQTPPFFRQGSRKVLKAVRKSSRYEMGSRRFYRASKQLQEMMHLFEAQRQQFFCEVAEEICSQFQSVKFKDPDLARLRQKHGPIIADYDFPQFLRIMKSTAASHGIKLEIEKDPSVFNDQSCA